MVATTMLDFASITDALRDRPLNANTRFEVASYVMSSGFISVATVATAFSVFRSKMVTLFPRPLLINPLSRSLASAMP